MIVIEARTRELEYKLARLAAAARVDYGLVIREEARFVTQQLIQFTPPKTMVQGKAAIAFDFTRLTTQLEYSYFKARETTGGFYKSIANYIRKRENTKLQALFNNRALNGFYGLTLLTNPQQILEQHKNRRTQYGRIRSGRRQFASYMKDSNTAMRTIQERVGWTASGWIPAAKVTGARYKKFSDRFGGKSGSQVSNFGRNPFILARNFNVKIPKYQNTVNAVLRSRIATTQKKLERVLANKAVNLGFTRVKMG